MEGGQRAVDPPRTQFLFRHFSIMVFMGSASAKSQKTIQESPFNRACTWTHAQQKSAETSRNCGSLASIYRSTVWEQSFHVPLYISYFLLEHSGMFLSTVVTHFINNWLCQPLMNKSSRGKRKHEFLKYFLFCFLCFSVVLTVTCYLSLSSLLIFTRGTITHLPELRCTNLSLFLKWKYIILHCTCRRLQRRREVVAHVRARQMSILVR